MLLYDDEGRREQDVIAGAPVERPAHRVRHQPARHAFALDAEVELQRRIERGFGHPITDELDAEKKSAAANVADVRMVAEALGEARRQRGTARADLGEESVALDDLLHGERCRASDRMAEIRVSVLEESCARR